VAAPSIDALNDTIVVANGTTGNSTGLEKLTNNGNGKPIP
jgi:hypothetical protein